MLEKTFQKNIMKLIESKGGYVINYNPGGIGKGGASDIISSINGIFVSIELKVYHKLNQRQALNLVKVNKSGGVGIVLKYYNDWKNKINLLFSDLKVADMRTRTHIVPEEFLKKVI